MKSPSLLDSTVERIIRLIAEKGLKDSQRIPNERELSEMLGVSRSTVREAIRVLAARNVLYVRRGVGAFVSYKHGVADDPLGLELLSDKAALANDMLEFRMLLEPRMSALAALNASDDDIVELEYLCGYVDELIMKGEDHLKADMEYHTKIARCSRNLLMPKVLPIIHSGIGLFISETMNKLSQETMLTHRAVLDAIKLHDPIAASDAMTMHLMYNRCMLRDARRNENPQSH